MTDRFEQTPRNRVRQIRDKARYQHRAVEQVLDAAFVAQVGFVQDGLPVVVPMIYGRQAHTLYLHGARKARIIKLLASQAQVCINVTLVDGIVAARSAFNSSLQYRSATLFGEARLLDQGPEHVEALRVITENTIPGRWQELRPPADRELKQTGVIAVEIETASAKISAGEPDDEDEDYATPVWAGVVPIKQTMGQPRDDGRLLAGVEVSPSIQRLVRQES
ncbi:MAG: pyridoxamine 5'-phosphate oxidase family protein [Xanthomonadales bacterium]|nr:pyridoxamine 5'-phosphate oxidase family protein [Xanthomonadales bacterium]